VKVLLPQDDALVKIDGAEVKGSGTNRSLDAKVPAGQETIIVSAFWEPNNYTKIPASARCRSRPQEVEVDLRKQDLKEPTTSSCATCRRRTTWWTPCASWQGDQGRHRVRPGLRRRP